MNPKKKASYSKPSLTVHGTVEALTLTFRCARHCRTNCPVCSPPCPSS